MDIQREIILTSTTGSLGTLSEDGLPFVSLVTVAARAPTATSPTNVVMLLSGLAKHTKNLDRQSKCSLLLVQSGGETGDPLAGARLTLVGTASRIDGGQVDQVRTLFLDKHPEAAMYVDFADFRFYEIEIQAAHLVAGFGRIESFKPDQL